LSNTANFYCSKTGLFASVFAAPVGGGASGASKGRLGIDNSFSPLFGTVVYETEHDAQLEVEDKLTELIGRTDTNSLDDLFED
jgi:hypothetical protein